MSGYKRWDTPTGLPPIKVRYGDYGWQTQVQLGDMWVAAEYVKIEYAMNRSRYGTVTLTIPGHLAFERIPEGQDEVVGGAGIEPARS